MPGQPAEIDFSARYLFGAPGPTSRCPARSWSAHPKATASRALKASRWASTTSRSRLPPSRSRRKPRPTRRARDAAGADPGGGGPSAYGGALRAAESGGRAVERSVTLPILPDGPVIGVRKNFGGELAEGSTATFDVVLVSPDGRRLARPGVGWSLVKVERRYQWFSAGGRWGYEPILTKRRVADGRIDLASGDPGAHCRAGAMGPVPAGGERAGPRRNRAHERLLLGRLVGRTDGGDPRPPRHGAGQGELPLRRAHGPAPLAAVCRQGDPRCRRRRVHEIRTVDLSAEKRMSASRSVPNGVPAPMWWRSHTGPRSGRAPPAGACARGCMVRRRSRRPRAAGGACGACADTPAGNPEAADPNRGLERRRAGSSHGGRRRCRHPEPDPLSCARSGRVFLRPAAALHRNPRPLRLSHRWHGAPAAPSVRAATWAARSRARRRPGAARALFRHRRGRTRRHGGGRIRRPVLQRHGPRDGGRLDGGPGRPRRRRRGHPRSRRGVGHAPRFLSVGDQSRFFMQIDNVEGPAGDYTINLDINGPIVVAADALRSRVRLEAKRTRNRDSSHRGGRDRHGDRRYDGHRSGISRRPALLAAHSARELVAGAPRRPSLAERREPDRLADLLADILPGTGAVSVSVSPLAALDVPGLLQALDRYPYGCTEQIVSRALPLLYVNRLSAKPWRPTRASTSGSGRASSAC